MTRVLVIDNYDSFVFNLVQYLGEAEVEPIVFRNDELSVDQAIELGPDAVLISPGPGRPEDAGICNDLIEAVPEHLPLFGVCLGHQCIGQVFGGEVVRAPLPMHGKVSRISHDGSGVFARVPTPLDVTRYHSLVVDEDSVPDQLIVTAGTEDGLVMGLRHRTRPIEGVQFHPESIATEHGHQMVNNFVANLT